MKRYRLQQLNNRKSNVVIYKIIDKFYGNESGLKTPKKIASKALKKTRNLLFRHVLFLLRADAHIYDFFTEDQNKMDLPSQIKNEREFQELLRKTNSEIKDITYLGINRDIHNFMLRQAPILESALLALLVQFLEKVNTVPNLSQKLLVATEEYHFQRNIPEGEKQRLFEYQQDICFYCGKKVDPQQEKMQADHFIPYTYIFESQIWNIVGACPQCNLKKSNRITQETYLDKIVSRNRDPAFSAQFFKPYDQSESSIKALNILLENLYMSCRIYFKSIDL